MDIRVDPLDGFEFDLKNGGIADQVSMVFVVKGSHGDRAWKRLESAIPRIWGCHTYIGKLWHSPHDGEIYFVLPI